MFGVFGFGVQGSGLEFQVSRYRAYRALGVLSVEFRVEGSFRVQLRVCYAFSVSSLRIQQFRVWSLGVGRVWCLSFGVWWDQTTPESLNPKP